MKMILVKLGFVALAMSLTACGFAQVDTGYRGIKTTFGEVQGEPLPEGLHFYNPFTSSIREYAVREQKIEGTTPVFTMDTQNVEITFTLTYYPDPSKVHTLFKEIGYEDDLITKIVNPIALGSIKDSVGGVKADDLVGSREIVRRKAFEEVKTNLAARSVFVTDLQFTNLDFDNQYERAVEEKVVATQLAAKAKNETVRIMEEAKQKVETAKADAEAMRIKSEALSKNKALVEFEAVQKWDGKLPVYMMGNSTPFIDMRKLGDK